MWVYWMLKFLGVSYLVILNGGMGVWVVDGLLLEIKVNVLVFLEVSIWFFDRWLVIIDDVFVVVSGV